MTKHDDSGIAVGRDRPVEIEITDEMVQAGVEVLWESGCLVAESIGDTLLIREILDAALLQDRRLDRPAPACTR